MKENEAPEKIYISTNSQDGTYYISNQYKRLIEYTRTDAFIKMACDWFRRIDYDNSMPLFETTEEFVKAFKKHMKGEEL